MLETKFQLTIWDSYGWKSRKHLYNFYFLLTFVKLLIPEPDPNVPNKSLRSQHYCTKYLADPPNTMELILVIFIESVILVYTISPCQYHDSLSIPWVLGNTMSSCQFKRYLIDQLLNQQCNLDALCDFEYPKNCNIVYFMIGVRDKLPKG